jgi:hypothetical protein
MIACPELVSGVQTFMNENPASCQIYFIGRLEGLAKMVFKNLPNLKNDRGIRW